MISSYLGQRKYNINISIGPESDQCLGLSASPPVEPWLMWLRVRPRQTLLMVKLVLEKAFATLWRWRHKNSLTAPSLQCDETLELFYRSFELSTRKLLRQKRSTLGSDVPLAMLFLAFIYCTVCSPHKKALNKSFLGWHENYLWSNSKATFRMLIKCCGELEIPDGRSEVWVGM